MRFTLQLIRLGSAKRLTQSGAGVKNPEAIEPLRYDPA